MKKSTKDNVLECKFSIFQSQITNQVDQLIEWISLGYQLTWEIETRSEISEKSEWNGEKKKVSFAYPSSFELRDSF